MATTRLGQIGIGSEPYAGFAAKVPGRSSAQITRLTQAAIGGRKYAVFQAKTAAAPQPEEEEFLGFPAISPLAIEGDGYGVLPDLFGFGQAVHGIVGRGRGNLSSIVGRGVGDVGVVGIGVVRVAAVRGLALGDHGQQGEGVASIKGLDGAASGAIGVHGFGTGTVLLGIKGTAVGQYDDEEAAMIALLLAA